MSITTNKYKLPVHFFTAKLAWYPFATINYLNVLTFLSKNTSIYLHLRPNLIKNINTQKIYPKAAQIYTSTASDARNI